MDYSLYFEDYDSLSEQEEIKRKRKFSRYSYNRRSKEGAKDTDTVSQPKHIEACVGTQKSA